MNFSLGAGNLVLLSNFSVKMLKTLLSGEYQKKNNNSLEASSRDVQFPQKMLFTISEINEIHCGLFQIVKNVENLVLVCFVQFGLDDHICVAVTCNWTTNHQQQRNYTKFQVVRYYIQSYTLEIQKLNCLSQVFFFFNLVYNFVYFYYFLN